jgi:REP element-mobilizing transposase RayT
VIMPNHAHWLMRPMPGWALSDIMKSVKGSSARLINNRLGRKGAVWMADYFDRYIRGANHFEKAVRYIENNPVKAGLCCASEDWPFSSADPETRARLDG